MPCHHEEKLWLCQKNCGLCLKNVDYVTVCPHTFQSMKSVSGDVTWYKDIIISDAK